MKKISELSCDVLIIGSGAAGLSLALRLAERYRVVVLSKGPVSEGATYYAQGGIAAVFDELDSIDAHVEDTLIAGAGLCDPQAVRFIASNARHCLQWLIDRGVAFDRSSDMAGTGGYHLTREGGHSHRRILHAADATGKAVATTLTSEALRHPNIQIAENQYAIDIILSDPQEITGSPRAAGAWVWDKNSGQVSACRAQSVVLATGGAAQVYRYTTNPVTATGDGIAMAWRAGCRIANLEFNQFHPTALYHPQASSFLLTEALRGEGAWLVRPDGSRFMPETDSRAELAPRDIVTRAINSEMKRLNAACMYLDISHKPATFIRQHFPTICQKLAGVGLVLTCDRIPIVPAAHYTCGGVLVDQRGRTDVDRLWAIGEVSYTGLHGANRMASNSLLECLVYGWAAAEDILAQQPAFCTTQTLPDCTIGAADNAHAQQDFALLRQELQQIMWENVGIVRTTKKLEHAQRHITELQQQLEEYAACVRLCGELLELRNMAQVAHLMAQCALARKESRGLHFTLDYPNQSSAATPTILAPYGDINR
jgi:L-aspartate oxidase